MRDFALFTYSDVDGRAVTAGHRYPTSKAKHYDTAWCYTVDRVDGAVVRRALGTLEYGATRVFKPGPKTQAALRLAGFSRPASGSTARRQPPKGLATCPTP